VLFDLDQLRLSLPFSVYVHDLLGDLDDPDRGFEEVVARQPGDRYWALVVSNFAASGALSTGDLARAVREARRGLEADPEGTFFFWHTAGQAYLGAALALQGDLDQGLSLLEEAWARYTAVGLRVNGVTLLASRAQALAQAGRLDDAVAALADAQRELAAYDERYAEPALLLAEAVVLDAQGEDRVRVSEVLAHAAQLATAQGGHGIARRVRTTAEALAYRI
jgi:tetratricopeptide (TPR) repeat protein